MAISMMAHPKLQISAGKLCPVWEMTSGAMKNAVPSNVKKFSDINCFIFAHPKSASLMFPDSSTRILSPKRVSQSSQKKRLTFYVAVYNVIGMKILKAK